MANFVITITRSFSPPFVGDNSAELTSNKYTFKLSDFTKDYTDAEADPYMDMIIKSLPGVGQLKYNNLPVVVGHRLKITDIVLLTFHLSDNYVIDDGVVYEFDSDIDTIILQYEAAGYNMASNENGLMTFKKQGNEYLIKKVQGEIIQNTALAFLFTVIEDSPKNLESNQATFSLIPLGDINVKDVYINLPPTVGDNTIEL